ncbi:hypothetical protein DFP73DRAFT_490590 [Morchella snyderi]|nr:hypothetical protein DFP73DRAFT_490590 [Morchella snyderi]
MFRNTLQKLPVASLNSFITLPQSATFTMTSRKLAGDDNPIHRAADKVGEKVPSDKKNPSILSSGGAIGKQFNPDGNIGQIGEKIGGPFSSKGAIGSQFDAAQGGIAGTVERAVDGPSQQGQGTPGKNNGKK